MGAGRSCALKSHVLQISEKKRKKRFARFVLSYLTSCISTEAQRGHREIFSYYLAVDIASRTSTKLKKIPHVPSLRGLRM